MAITLDGTNGITTPDITSTAGFDSADLTGDIAAARITNALNATGSAPIYACRAWVNFDGTGTPAIREDGNVSSITDVDTGRYVVNITTAMPDANGAAVGTAIPGTASDANSNRIVYAACISTTTVRLNITSTVSGTSWADSEFVSLAIFR